MKFVSILTFYSKPLQWRKNKTTTLLESHPVSLMWGSHIHLWQHKFKPAPVSPLQYTGALFCRYFSLGMCSGVWSGRHSASIDIFVYFLNRRMQYYAKMIWTPHLTNITLSITSQAGGGFAFPVWQRRNGGTKQPQCYCPTLTVVLLPSGGFCSVYPQRCLMHYICLYKPSASSFGGRRAVNLKFRKQWGNGTSGIKTQLSWLQVP